MIFRSFELDLKACFNLFNLRFKSISKSSLLQRFKNFHEKAPTCQIFTSVHNNIVFLNNGYQSCEYLPIDKKQHPGFCTQKNQLHFSGYYTFLL